jgi:plasmid stability protein
MAAITIRDLDSDVKERLRMKAASNGRSMEAEARAILEAATAVPERPKNIAVALIELGQKFGGIELPSRDPAIESQGHRDPFA